MPTGAQGNTALAVGGREARGGSPSRDPSELLATLARELALAIDLAAAGSTVIRHVHGAIKADMALLYVQRSPGSPLELVAADGLDAPAGHRQSQGPLEVPNWSIRSGIAFASNDTRRDPRVTFLGHGPQPMSVMYAPLHLDPAGGGGALVVCNRKPNAFTTDQLRLLCALADQSSVAISNALLMAEAERRAERLALVGLAGQRIAAQRSPADVLRVSVVEIARIFDLAHASLYTLDDLAHVTAEAHHQDRALCTVRELGWIRSYQRPLVVPDLRHSDMLPDLRLRLLEQGVHSVLAAPLSRDGRTIGALLLFATATQRPFTREAQELAGILAGQTAVALEQSRLFQTAVDAQEHGEAILQSSFTAIITVDPRLRIQAANAAAAELLGLPPDYLRRRPLSQALGAQAWGDVAPVVAEVRRTGEPSQTMESVIESRARPHRREVLLGVAALPDGLVVSLTDITRLKDVDRLKNELVANVSHDLKAPLATIRAYTELLLEGLDHQDPDLRQTFLGHIDDEVERLNGYITNMLDLARIEAEGLQLRREPLSLSWLLEEAAAGVAQRAAAREITVAVELPKPDITLGADRHLLHSLLANLLGNAVKFSPRGERVTLRACSEQDGVRIAVADNGPGIPAAKLPHVFEKFYRGSFATEGSGLGLVIARQAAWAHGGDILVDSQEGQGSVFTVYLPSSTILRTEMPAMEAASNTS